MKKETQDQGKKRGSKWQPQSGKEKGQETKGDILPANGKE